ncbi:MAG: hypothetical protein E7439_00595 [Ruminococcaceae bacterium]|nr:hypothetical protein [Oscillospiraceae bacterium]
MTDVVSDAEQPFKILAAVQITTSGLALLDHLLLKEKAFFVLRNFRILGIFLAMAHILASDRKEMAFTL